MVAEVNEALVHKILGLLEHGLTSGLGSPEPGKFCVEAMICYAMGEDHGDNPACVSQSLRKLKIKLNDANWSSNTARANGLRRLAIVQLGSAGALDEREFAKRVSRLAIQMSVPAALRAAASMRKNSEHKDRLLHWADVCEKEPTEVNARSAKEAAYAAAAYAAYGAAAYAAASAADAAADAAAYYAADAYARDKSLAQFCEAVVQILIEMDVPGAKFLHLAPVRVAMGVAS